MNISPRAGKKGLGKALACLALTMAVGAALGVGGTLLYLEKTSAVPEKAFAYWYGLPNSVPEDNGVTLILEEVRLKPDGSGSIQYTLENRTDEELYWVDVDPAIDYLEQGESHRVYPLPVHTMEGPPAPSLPAGESVSFTLELEPCVLALPGTYSLYVDSIGRAEFEVTQKGEALFSSP